MHLELCELSKNCVIGTKPFSTSFAWNKIRSCSLRAQSGHCRTAVDMEKFQTWEERGVGAGAVNNKMNENAAVF